MIPRVRLIMVTGIAMILAVVLGAELANENYFLTSLLVAALLWIVADWTGGPLPETWAVAAIIVGYIVGNRGFAQASLSSRFPLLPAETTLALCVPTMLVRAACKQLPFMRRDALNFAVAAWMAAGAMRLPLDLRAQGVTAIRDFAMVYYAAFFFIAQMLGQHGASARLLRRGLTLAFVSLPVVAALYERMPDFFSTHLTLRDIPLIYHKSDLIATSLAAGFFWLWSRQEEKPKAYWLLVAGASLALIPTMESARAAMIGTAGGTLLWIAAGRWRVLGFQVALVAAAIIGTLAVLVFLKRDGKDTVIYSAYEHAVSVVDFQGKGTYFNRDSGDPGDNNRFRLVWWHAVYREVLEDNPLFGLGFGYDLSARFLADYDWLMVGDFAARSPHSMLLTMFGRMGALGLALWLAIAAAMAARTWRVVRARDYGRLGLWSVVWVTWISACFGVVLEGPMGAVVFWVALGLASAPTPAPRTDEPAADSSEAGLLPQEHATIRVQRILT